jgi:glycosyltransferase involved in cell wall biosynthesis
LLDIKGPELLLQALGGPLRGEDIGLALLAPLVGSSFEAHVRSLVDAEPRARLLPPRDPIGTLAAMASADAVVVPSIWKETGPYTVIEAQWTGAPVIGSNLAGILERLESDPSSELFQTNDVDDLACAIRRSRERMDGDAARQKRARDFRERYADSFEVALGRVLDTVLKKA